MGADLSNILKIQRLSEDHIQFLVYQVLRGLKVGYLKHSFWLNVRAVTHLFVIVTSSCFTVTHSHTHYMLC